MKGIQYSFICLCACLILSACFPKEGGEEEKTENQRIYQIYYLDSSFNKLESQEYEILEQEGSQGTDYESWLIETLMEQMRAVGQNLDFQPALPEKVRYEGYRLEDNILYLYFDSSYTLMESTREILCRAALASTFTQIDGVDYISIYTASQPLMDRSKTPVGPVGASDFVGNISDVNIFEKTELTLYFSDLEGEKLVQEKRVVVHNINTSLEKLVIEQLIAGPSKSGMVATLPKDTKLLNVSVNENVCYINFDAAFMNNTLEVKEYIPIYSLVNSLSEVSAINKVQITVNGSQDGVFRDIIPLKTIFERNLDYNADSEHSSVPSK